MGPAQQQRDPFVLEAPWWGRTAKELECRSECLWIESISNRIEIEINQIESKGHRIESRSKSNRTEIEIESD